MKLLLVWLPSANAMVAVPFERPPSYHCTPPADIWFHDFFLCPETGFFHAVDRNHRVAAVRGTGSLSSALTMVRLIEAELIERRTEVNQAFLVGGHAGFDQGIGAVIVGLPGFVDEGVLQEILLETGVGGPSVMVAVPSPLSTTFKLGKRKLVESHAPH